MPTARAMFQASPCGVVEAPERASAAGRRPASQVRGAGRARGCRTRRTGCLNAVSMLSQLRLIVVSLLRLAAPSGRRPRARVARALCAAMSAEGWLPRDKQEDGGLFASLESLLSQGSDWECEWREPNAHNDTGASVRDGGAAGDAPRVPRVRARGASPSLANVLALASARGAHRPNTRARPSATCTRHAGLTARGARRAGTALGARCRRALRAARSGACARPRLGGGASVAGAAAALARAARPTGSAAAAAAAARPRLGRAAARTVAPSCCRRWSLTLCTVSNCWASARRS